MDNIKIKTSKFGWWENFAPSLHSRAHNWDFTIWKNHIQDMAKHCVRALILYTHWYCTGYKSRFPWLDQTDSENIRTNNGLLKDIIGLCRDEGIEIYLANQIYTYAAKEFGMEFNTSDEFIEGNTYWNQSMMISTGENSTVRRRILDMYYEQLELFPNIDGFIIEGERRELANPWDEESYNTWAKSLDRPGFNEAFGIKRDTPEYENSNIWLEMAKNNPNWRDFITWKEASISNDIAWLLWENGFTGKVIYTYCMNEIDPLGYTHETDGKISLLTYNYNFDMPEGVTALKSAQSTGVEVIYVVDGQVGWYDMDIRHTDKIRKIEAWKTHIEEAKKYKPGYFIFFGYEWNDISGTPEENREMIYRLVEEKL